MIAYRVRLYEDDGVNAGASITTHFPAVSTTSSSYQLPPINDQMKALLCSTYHLHLGSTWLLGYHHSHCHLASHGARKGRDRDDGYGAFDPWYHAMEGVRVMIFPSDYFHDDHHQCLNGDDALL